jgi:ribose 1,5-bisphosphokinase
MSTSGSSYPAATNGRIVYIVGPSGAGKDTLMAFARTSLGGTPVLFAQRYVTRPAEAGHEAHAPLTPAEFAFRQERGLFALSWDSHGLSYGIGIEIDQWLARGCTVVVNGSRAAFAMALARYADLLPVLITASPETLRRRLVARGREDARDIENRLGRLTEAPFNPSGLVTIANDTSIEAAGTVLVRLLRGVASLDISETSHV